MYVPYINIHTLRTIGRLNQHSLGFVLLAMFLAQPFPAGQMAKGEGGKNQPAGNDRQQVHPESAGHAHGSGCPRS